MTVSPSHLASSHPPLLLLASTHTNRKFLTKSDKENIFTLDHFPVWYRRAAEYPAGKFLYYVPMGDTRGTHTHAWTGSNTHTLTFTSAHARTHKHAHTFSNCRDQRQTDAGLRRGTRWHTSKHMQSKLVCMPKHTHTDTQTISLAGTHSNHRNCLRPSHTKTENTWFQQILSTLHTCIDILSTLYNCVFTLHICTL